MLFTQDQKKHAGFLSIAVLALVAVFLVALSINEFKETKYIGTGGDVPNTLTFSGFAEISVEPDTAKVNFSVEETSDDVSEAQEVVSGQINSILNDVSNLGIRDKDIRTNSYTTNPKYNWTDDGRILEGYTVRQSIEITIRDIDDVEDVISILGSNDVTNLSGPYFEIEDEEEYERLARQEAIAAAKEKAEGLANDLGVKLVRIVSFNEGGSPGYPEPRFYEEAAMSISLDSVGGSSVPSPEIPIGENIISANVTITYEIQ
jgi:uncharacterized protein YggE